MKELLKAAANDLGYPLMPKEENIIRDAMARIRRRRLSGDFILDTLLVHKPYLTSLVEQGIDQMTPTQLLRELKTQGLDLKPRGFGRKLAGYGIYSYKATIQGKQQRVYDLKQILEII